MNDTNWDDADVKIALIVIPNIVPIPFGKEIISTTTNNDFIDEMQRISNIHGFWAQTMGGVVDQFETDNHTKKVFKWLISSTIVPFLDISLLGKNSYKADQEKLKAFYCRNPTPACGSSNKDVAADNDEDAPQVLVHSTTASAFANPPRYCDDEKYSSSPTAIENCR